MVHRVFLLIAVLGVAGACSAAQHAPPRPAAKPLAELVPATAAGFRQVGSEVLPDGNGTLFRFRDTSAVYMSVILYAADPGARSRFPAPDSLLGYEGAKFAQVIEIQARRGLYRNHRVIASRPDSVPVARGGMRGYTSLAAGVLRGRPVVEYQRLFLLDTTFVKVRATVPGASWPRPDLDTATAAILAALIGGNGG